MRAPVVLAAALLPASAVAAEPHRSFHDLPSSNGYGAVVLDLQQARVHHWRDHLFATEEPQWDAGGSEVWIDDQPQPVFTRDLLFDSYFGFRIGTATAGWLPGAQVDFDASGWGGIDGSTNGGGTGLVALVQDGPGFRATTWAWAPWGIERSAMAMVLELENTGTDDLSELQMYSLQNLHLGEGRPGPDVEIGAENETIVLGEGIEERGFAGVVGLRPLLQPIARGTWHPGSTDPNPFELVEFNAPQDFVPSWGDQGVHDDSVSYLRWNWGTLQPGQVARVGMVLAHDPDPFAWATVDAELVAWIDGATPEQILERERAGWSDWHAGLTPPVGLPPQEEALYRHSAAVLRMAQVRESRYTLREHLSRDGEPRYSAFGALPGTVEHFAQGSVLASLPPGRWTYAWPRDAAYAAAGMAHAGMQEEAADALRFVLTAWTDRYRLYDELAGVPVEPYAVSLCRHHGFGIEESDTLGGGDFNFEFDGAGLTLWALGEYVRATGDWTLVEELWPTLRDRTAGFLEALIEPDTGLIAEDSSIWEHHWLGKERAWAYTSITAARGLCEAAAFADQLGDPDSAARFADAGRQVRAAVLEQLVDSDGVIAATAEELAVGGYYDGAVLEAIGMGLIDPAGMIAPATLAAVVEELQTADGPGLARNDDAWDAHDLSPWGSGYDSDEWVMIDLRASVAARLAGEAALADDLLDWVTAQSVANYLAIGETYDPITADYTNNAPMVGFGPGAWILAVHLRDGLLEVDPACGDWPQEPLPGDDDDAGDDDDSAPAEGDDDDSAGVRIEDIGGCDCAVTGAPGGLVALAVLAAARRRRQSAG